MKKNRIKLLLIGLFLLLTYLFINQIGIGKVYISDGTIQNYDLNVNNNFRSFKTKVHPNSDEEKVILDAFKAQIIDDYDAFKDIYIGDKSSSSYKDYYKEQTKEGMYTRKVVIHSLEELSEDIYTDKSMDLKYYHSIDKLKEYNPYEYKVFDVNYTITYTEKLNRITQWGNGNYTRYYVVTREKEGSDWKIFHIFGHI